jgi:phosphatidylglycerol:prolipoprotein diacylglycerol transferase
MHPIINVFGIKIGTYGLMVLLGIICAFIVAKVITKKSNREFDWECYLFALVFGLVGSVLLKAPVHIANVITHWRAFSGLGINELLIYIFGEIVFLGGMFGGIVGAIIYCKIFNRNLIERVDLCAICLPLAHAFGRVGCLFAGCCYGNIVEETHPFAVEYPSFSIEGFTNPLAPAGVPLLNVPILEATFLMIIFVINIIVYFKSKRVGLTSAIYFILYGIWRMFIEGFRGDTIRGFLFGISTSRYLSVITIFIGILIGVVQYKKSKINDEKGCKYKVDRKNITRKRRV